ncbi:MAG: carboxypeptidase-like regulatory protein [Chitinophagaceae bacterium]|nr:carboxypeptidase-like regulatory protein [Chitinophagaceae bacterium]
MKLCYLILLFLLSVSGWSQYKVYGTITDQLTHAPLRGVTVFVNGSSYATLTDTAGNFTFENMPVKVFDLVATRPGYTMGVYRTGIKTASLKIIFQLSKEESEPENNNKDSLSNNLQRWSEPFMSAFIGTSANSYDCYIANPKVLRFNYIDSLQALSVTATEPLQIFNEALGYIVYYYLNDLLIRTNGLLNNTIIYNNSYHYFKELTSKQSLVIAKWKLKRQNAYSGSSLHFMRTLYNNTLREEGFRVRKVNRVYENNPAYSKFRRQQGSVQGKIVGVDSTGNSVTVNYAEAMENISVEDYIHITDNITWFTPSSSTLEITYQKTSQPLTTFIHVQGGKLLLESNGLYFEQDDLLQEGYWRLLGIADKLPCNFDQASN